MKKILAVAALALGATVAVSGCDPFAPYNDLENAPVTDPDSVVVYTAPDKFPNIAVTCIDGAAIVSTTREAAVTYVPALDPTCAR